jgi:hypothetical protein
MVEPAIAQLFMATHAGMTTEDFEMGSKRHACFLRADLAPPTLPSESIIGAGSSSFDQVRFTTEVLIAVLPHLEALGVV